MATICFFERNELKLSLSRINKGKIRVIRPKAHDSSVSNALSLDRRGFLALNISIVTTTNPLIFNRGGYFIRDKHAGDVHCSGCLLHSQHIVGDDLLVAINLMSNTKVLSPPTILSLLQEINRESKTRECESPHVLGLHCRGLNVPPLLCNEVAGKVKVRSEVVAQLWRADDVPFS